MVPSEDIGLTGVWDEHRLVESHRHADLSHAALEDPAVKFGIQFIGIAITRIAGRTPAVSRVSDECGSTTMRIFNVVLRDCVVVECADPASDRIQHPGPVCVCQCIHVAAVEVAAASTHDIVKPVSVVVLKVGALIDCVHHA